MSRKALLAKLIAKNPNLPGELAKVSVAADLTILVAESGISRSDLAKRLGWSRARVSQVLSGQGNLTIETIHAVAQAAGFAFGAFRKPEAAPALQVWEKTKLIRLAPSATLEFPDGRKAKAADFQRTVGAYEINIDMRERVSIAQDEKMEWRLAA